MQMLAHVMKIASRRSRSKTCLMQRNTHKMRRPVTHATIKINEVLADVTKSKSVLKATGLCAIP